ncbi:MAG TPA: class I SAM-dependent methyltransferase [Thermoanaerobaculia bacterium]
MLPTSLSLDQGWGVGEESFAQIVEHLRAIEAKSIVEFGSGISSVRLALELPDAQIVSIESNRQWFETVTRMRTEHGVEKNLTVHHRPLRWQRHGLGFFLSYEPGELPEQIDGVIIDGPPTWTRRGREACLYQVVRRLRVGGRVLLDDYRRNREKTMVRNWTWSFPGVFATSAIATGHGLCLMEKLAEPRGFWPSLRAWPDHFIEVLGVLLTHPLRPE